MNCPKCKKKLKDNVNFCGFCGYKFEENIKKNSKSKDETNYNNVCTGVVAAPGYESMPSETPQSSMNRYLKQQLNKTSTSQEKDASVVGRGIAGGLIAGPAGAVVGALSAIDKNNKKNK